MINTGGAIRDHVDILDLSQNIYDPGLAGYSSAYSNGIFLILVPYRNSHEPRNGQRGHGKMVRLDLNAFNPSGIVTLDLSTATRTQVEYFAFSIICI